ncbi:hypothetical protein ACWATR_38685, partial [Nostoc sp. UIC 10890]
MSYSKSLQRFISLAATIVLVWVGIVPGSGQITAVHAQTINNKIVLEQPITSSYNGDELDQSLDKVVTRELVKPSNDWYEIDQHLVNAVRNAYNSSENYAITELEDWQNELMQKVDDKFLNWYFSYGNQKLMEFGVPFAWIVFKLDSSLKLFRTEEERNLTAGEIVKERMTQDFNNKFHELVLNEDSEKSFKRIVERIGRAYASAMSIQFLTIKSQYKINDPDWKEHLIKISQLIYNTGNSQSSLAIDSFNSDLFTKAFTFTTATVGLKLAANFAAKAGSKIAAKAGASAIAKAGAQLLDPILIVGFLAWDVWDYNHMVAQSKPQLRQNISDYLREVKYSILSAPDNSIMAALKDVESKFLDGIES